MRIKNALAAMIGLSMVSTPVLAQSASALSVAPAMSRAGATMGDASLLDDEGYIIPGVILVAILAAAILFTSNEDRDLNNPQSP